MLILRRGKKTVLKPFQADIDICIEQLRDGILLDEKGTIQEFLDFNPVVNDLNSLKRLLYMERSFMNFSNQRSKENTLMSTLSLKVRRNSRKNRLIV